MTIAHPLLNRADVVRLPAMPLGGPPQASCDQPRRVRLELRVRAAAKITLARGEDRGYKPACRADAARRRAAIVELTIDDVSVEAVLDARPRYR